MGFENAGFHVAAAFDKWEAALDVYRANFGHPAIKIDLADRQASVEAVGKFCPDIIIGGPPCQDFSSAGKRNEDGGRGDLTLSYANIVGDIRPKWFVMENVATITKTRKLSEARGIFHKAGYGLTQATLNSALCGVPQRRKRFILIGHLCEKDGFMDTTLANLLSSKETTLRDYFGNSLKLQYYYRHPRSYARRGVFSIDEPSPTIRGVNRPIPNGYKLHANDPVDSLEGLRPLTTKERSMVQTFPADFKFKGSKSDVEQMIGNAVPVKLGEFVAKAIVGHIGVKKNKSNTH